MRSTANNAVATLWIEALDKQAGGVGTVFRVRFQDVDDYTQLALSLENLSLRYPFVTPPKISSIEVACDFRHKTGSVVDTLAMTHRLQSSLYADGTKPRQFDPSPGIYQNRYLDCHGDRLDPNLNFRIGNKNDPLSWQCYFKKVDKKLPLPEDQWRARVEVTLRGPAPQEYGLNLLSDLQHFRFDKLASLFRFRYPIPPEQMAAGDLFRLTAIKINRELHDATPDRGIHSFATIGRRDKFRKTRATSSHLQADEELRNAVKGALRRLVL